MTKNTWLKKNRAKLMIVLNNFKKLLQKLLLQAKKMLLKNSMKLYSKVLVLEIEKWNKKKISKKCMMMIISIFKILKL